MNGFDIILRRYFVDVHQRSPTTLNDRVLQIGAGGVGTWFAILYAMSCSHDAKLIVVDNDVLEPSNANRLPYPLNIFYANMPKSYALRKYLSLLRPGLGIEVYKADIRELDIESLVNYNGINVIVDATDNVETQKVIEEKARRLRKHLLSLHYDGEHISVIWCPNGECIDTWSVDEEARHYTTPSLAYVPVVLAGIGVSILIHKPNRPLIETYDLRLREQGERNEDN